MLHGFPTSSHMFRNLIPLLADRYHVVAPDLPGFGFTVAPDRQHFAYKFDNLAKVIEDFTVAIRLKQYAIHVFDYGAPVGFRSALLSRPGNDDIQLDLFLDYASQRRPLSQVPGLFCRAQAAFARGVGQERSVLSTARRRGVQARQSQRRSAFLRQVILHSRPTPSISRTRSGSSSDAPWAPSGTPHR